MKKKIIIIALLLAMLSAPIFANEKYYESGDSKIDFGVGLSIPNFIYFFSANGSQHDQGFLIGNKTNLGLGGDYFLGYDFFVAPSISVGASITGFIYFDAGVVDLNIVPLSLTLKWVPLQSTKYEMPISLSAGAAFINRENTKTVSPYVAAGIDGVYYFHKNWGVGLRASVVLLGSFDKSSPASLDNGLISFTPISMTINYRFDS